MRLLPGGVLPHTTLVTLSLSVSPASNFATWAVIIGIDKPCAKIRDGGETNRLTEARDHRGEDTGLVECGVGWV